MQCTVLPPPAAVVSAEGNVPPQQSRSEANQWFRRKILYAPGIFL